MPHVHLVPMCSKHLRFLNALIPEPKCKDFTIMNLANRFLLTPDITGIKVTRVGSTNITGILCRTNNIWG